MNSPSIWIIVAGILTASAAQQQPSPSTPAPAAVAPAVDAPMLAAQDLIGKALFLRGFYFSNTLVYDPAGKLEGPPQALSRTTDWTLSGINILKASRQAPDALELEGVRVAIRYNPDAHEFQRHPLNDDKIKLLVHLAAVPGPQPTTPTGALAQDPEVRQLRAAFAAIFSIGIDPALQRSMPPLWRHYFDPSTPWPATSTDDPLATESIYNLAPLPPIPNQPGDILPPRLDHQVSSDYTPEARHDNVKGQVQLRMVVDANGTPQRIVVIRPLGYGLERQAQEAMLKWRFTPATHAGRPVATTIVVNMEFETPPSPPR